MLRHEPPRAVTLGVLLGLAALLVYPLHRPYLHPDQDVPPTLALIALVRGSWQPLVVQYGSALPNLLHVMDEIAFRIGRAAGWWAEPIDMLVAWCRAPWVFRLPPRAIAMAGGIVSLLAVRGIVAQVADGWSALAAPLILGTWILFVREHHHGWYDAPAAGCAMLALWSATVYVREPRRARIVAAGAFAGLAASFKYNLAVAGMPVLAAALAASGGGRVVAAAVGSAAGLAAFVATTPESVLETARIRDYLAAYIPLQARALAEAAGPGGNHLLETLARGIGWVGVGLAAVGLVLAAAARERLLVPVVSFVAVYAAVLVQTPLALSRYVLPAAGPLAVLAAYALSRLPPRARAAAVLCLLALGLPACLGYVDLLAREDTRVAALQLVERQWASGGRVVVAANPILASYVAPDVPQLPRYDPGLPPEREQGLAARVPACLRPWETMRPPAVGTDPLAAYAGALVVTSEHSAPTFARAGTPSDVAALLERRASLVADLQIGEPPPGGAYEVFDLNYVPFGGFGTLTRPGPRLRLWRVGATE